MSRYLPLLIILAAGVFVVVRYGIVGVAPQQDREVSHMLAPITLGPAAGDRAAPQTSAPVGNDERVRHN